MKKCIFCSFFSFLFSFCGICQAKGDLEPFEQEKIERSMLDKTKKAFMSYEVVEERTEEILETVQHRVFGAYAEKFAVLIPFVTGKVQFKVKDFGFSYSHFSDKAEVDYRLTEHWELFMKRKNDSKGLDEKSGVRYSFRF